jgi:two-component system sensor histidine kinase VicK
MQFTDGKDLKNMVLNAPIGICILDAKTLVGEIVNGKFLEVAGKPYEAIYAKFYWDAFAEARPYYENALLDVIRTGEAFYADEVELMLIRHGKEELIFVTFVYSPVKDEYGQLSKIAVWVLENTQQVKARQAIANLNEELATSVEELRAGNEELQSTNEELFESQRRLKVSNAELTISRERFRNMIQSSPVAMLVTRGENMVFEEINEMMLSMIGRDISVKGKPWFEAIPELVGQSIIDDLYHTYRTGDVQRVTEAPIKLTKNGQSYDGYYDITYTPLIEDGEIVGVMQSAIDVTAQITARIEVEKLNEALAVLNKSLSASNDEQSKVNNELAAVNEELAATNEEGHAMNEELTSANDALLVIQQKLQAETEEKQLAIERLKANERNIRNMVRQAPVGMCIVEGDPLFVMEINDSFLEIVGRLREEFDSKPYWEVISEAALYYRPITDNVMATGITYQANERELLLIRNGIPETVYVDFVYEPMKDPGGKAYAIMIVAIDVTDKVTHRQKVERAEESLRMATQAAGLGTYFINVIDRIFYPSEKLKEFFGFRPDEEMPYDAAINQIHPDYRQRVANMVEAAISEGAIYDTEYPIIAHNDGRIRWVRAIGAVQQDEKGTNRYFTGVLHDITEQKQDEIRKNDFIGMVSHELKTPLTSLNAVIQVTNQKLKYSEDKFLVGAMDKANQQVKRMTSMINGFLNISRLESGKILIEKQKFDIDKLLSEMIAESQITVNTHQFEFESCGDTEVFADRDKISSVISNLMSNAVKYSPKGKLILIQCKVEDGYVIVSVTDDGMGIKPVDIERIFDRYFRVESSHTQHISGFGIGLYLSAEIVRRHEGQIWATSEIGVGSTFYFSLPI